MNCDKLRGFVSAIERWECDRVQESTNCSPEQLIVRRKATANVHGMGIASHVYTKCKRS